MTFVAKSGDLLYNLKNRCSPFWGILSTSWEICSGLQGNWRIGIQGRYLSWKRQSIRPGRQSTIVLPGRKSAGKMSKRSRRWRWTSKTSITGLMSCWRRFSLSRRCWNKTQGKSWKSNYQKLLSKRNLPFQQQTGQKKTSGLPLMHLSLLAIETRWQGRSPKQQSERPIRSSSSLN